ncbi:precorrin-6y C5,15-methyltransferase (decarboxylating) subunit CbiE [Halodesulfovibrio sp.]|uniref:precorrin-6y C5,15-methyltransferase (decarboxylating) subunit CbiE n=1 Tax=Halodesulfovibrio sp. TaxID=1912772 RepID=UPI0025C19D48|nr:precorrin-6y C5,15-methyltransferase (decarboxylating) subunit CbiE [Halodesulfovibrio sp.]
MAIHVVGLGIDPDTLPEIHEQIITTADVLVGGKRQLEAFAELETETIPITAPLSDVFTAMAERYNARKEVVVIADGDPLFFGIGDRIIKEFGSDNVVIHPNTATVQAIAARANVSWQHMRMVSLHGRNDYTPLYSALMQCDHVVVLTDDTNIPAVIAQRLLDRGITWFRIGIFEEMGTDNEQLSKCSLEEASNRSFSRLNAVLLERTGKPEQQLRIGIPDTLFATERKLITKRPVRSASLGALELEPHHVMWDIGAGSGSVSIEAAHLLSHGAVYAVERKSERIDLIRENRARFGAINIDVRHGDAQTVLNELPTPDRIFIGGGLGSDASLLAPLCEALQEHGVLVVNCTLLSSLEAAKNHFKHVGWEYDVTMIQASTSRPLADDIRLDSMNPIFIISARKPVPEKTPD